MFKWLKSLFKKIEESKFWKFLTEVFNGKTGDFLDENHKEINESVQVVEEIANYLFQSKSKTYSDLKKEILIKYKVKISEEEIRQIYLEKSSGKFSLAYRISSENIKRNGKEFVENLVKSALSLGIELAVNRFFGK